MGNALKVLTEFDVRSDGLVVANFLGGRPVTDQTIVTNLLLVELLRKLGEMERPL